MPPAKVKIERIAGDRTRQNTFHKRKLGLIKKAIELTVLTDCDCAIILRSGPTAMCPEGRVSAYCNKDLDEMLTAYMSAPPSEYYSNAEYARFAKDCDIASGPCKPADNSCSVPAIEVDVESCVHNHMQEAYNETHEEMKQQVKSMEAELERLRSLVPAEEPRRKRSPPPISCNWQEEENMETGSKRQRRPEPQDELELSGEISLGEESRVETFMVGIEGSEVAPGGLMLRREHSGLAEQCQLSSFRTPELVHEVAPTTAVGREVSWDLSSFFSSTPSHAQPVGLFSPCRSLVTPSLMPASVPGCPLLPFAPVLQA